MSKFSAFIKKSYANPKTRTAASSIFAILAGMLIGIFVMFITIPGNIGYGIQFLFTGGARDWPEVFSEAMPIIFTGLSVGFAFKTGLFNIGATGQFTMGAIVAIMVGVSWTFLPGISHWIVAVLMGALAGAIWGAIPGFLKAKFSVHEVVATIMLNYIAMYLAIILVGDGTAFYDQTHTQTIPVAANAVNLFQFGDTKLNISFFIAILAVGGIHVLLNRTTFGFELRAVGKNKDGAKYAGINEKRNIILSMAIAGALAGLGGALLYLTEGNAYIVKANLLSFGFSGISVALIAMSNPIGILFSGIFLGYLKESGELLKLASYTVYNVEIITASIVYFAAFAALFKDKIFKILDRVLLKDGDE